MPNISSKGRGDIALLVSRLIIGGIFITTGWLKVSDIAATVGYFAQMGIPAFFAYAVGYLELVGGILIILGLWTCLVAAVLGVIMLFAIWYTRDMGFQGFATPLATLAALVALFGVCAGTYSLKCACGGKSSLLRGCCGSTGSCGKGDSCCCCESSGKCR